MIQIPRCADLARPAAFLFASLAFLAAEPAWAQPAAPTGFEVEQAGKHQGEAGLERTGLRQPGSVRHEVRFRASAAAFPDTPGPRIPSSRPGQDNAAGYLLDGLTAETAYDFELRAVSGDGPGAAASASATTLAPFTARFSPLKTWYEGDLVHDDDRVHGAHRPGKSCERECWWAGRQGREACGRVTTPRRGTSS